MCRLSFCPPLVKCRPGQQTCFLVKCQRLLQKPLRRLLTFPWTSLHRLLTSQRRPLTFPWTSLHRLLTSQRRPVTFPWTSLHRLLTSQRRLLTFPWTSLHRLLTSLRRLLTFPWTSLHRLLTSRPPHLPLLQVRVWALQLRTTETSHPSRHHRSLCCTPVRRYRAIRCAASLQFVPMVVPHAPHVHRHQLWRC